MAGLGRNRLDCSALVCLLPLGADMAARGARWSGRAILLWPALTVGKTGARTDGRAMP